MKLIVIQFMTQFKTSSLEKHYFTLQSKCVYLDSKQERIINKKTNCRIFKLTFIALGV